MITREFKFENGDEVQEKVTGFKGIITGTCFYITGCNQYLVVPKAQRNKNNDSVWYDEERLTLTKSKKIKLEEDEQDKPGPDRLPDQGKRGM